MIWEIFAGIFMFFVWAFDWLVSFAIMNTIIVRIILLPLALYCYGAWFTHIPFYALIILAFLPIVISGPILLIATFTALIQ